MDIFRYFAEDENKRFIFFFTFKPNINSVIKRLEQQVGYEVYVYDIFPEPYQESIVLDDLLSVITSNGSEMFIPSGLKVNIFSMSRALFGRKQPKRS